MLDKWMNLPRARRLGWAIGLLLLGAVLAPYEYRNGSGYERHYSVGLSLFAGGLTLLILDLIFHKSYLDDELSEVAQLDLANHAATVAPGKLAAVLEALALEFHGDFDRQKAALFTTLATLKGEEEFALAGRLDGAPAAMKLRARREDAGILKIRFYAPPEILARLDEVVGLALG